MTELQLLVEVVYLKTQARKILSLESFAWKSHQKTHRLFSPPSSNTWKEPTSVTSLKPGHAFSCYKEANDVISGMHYLQHYTFCLATGLKVSLSRMWLQSSQRAEQSLFWGSCVLEWGLGSKCSIMLQPDNTVKNSKKYALSSLCMKCPPRAGTDLASLKLWSKSARCEIVYYLS